MTPDPAGPVDTVGPVLVVGAGLLGTSVGLALSARGVVVWLTDVQHEHVRTATGLGAGSPVPDGARPSLVVVAVPPDHLAAAQNEVWVLQQYAQSLRSHGAAAL